MLKKFTRWYKETKLLKKCKQGFSRMLRILKYYNPAPLAFLNAQRFLLLWRIPISRFLSLEYLPPPQPAPRFFHCLISTYSSSHFLRQAFQTSQTILCLPGNCWYNHSFSQFMTLSLVVQMAGCHPYKTVKSVPRKQELCFPCSRLYSCEASVEKGEWAGQVGKEKGNLLKGNKRMTGREGEPGSSLPDAVSLIPSLPMKTSLKGWWLIFCL